MKEVLCPIPKGTLLIIGGKEDKGENEPNEKMGSVEREEILKTFIALMRNKTPVVEIITTATSEPQETFSEYEKLFTSFCNCTVKHINHDNHKEATDNELIQRVKEADGFFISGGDQLKLTSIYGGTPFLTALKQKYVREKIVVAGTSAGAMALSTPMIYAGNKEVQQINGEIKITTGLEFLKDVCIDTHFVERGRFVRMAQVIASNPGCIGIGIEENTAIIVKNGTEVTIAGSGTVIIIEGFGIVNTNIFDYESKKTVSVRNLTTHILSKEDSYEIPQTNPPHH